MKAIDRNGHELWSRKWALYPERLDLDNQGHIYLQGYFQGTANFDPGPGTHVLNTKDSRAREICVASYASTGAFRWAIGWEALEGGNCSVGFDIDMRGNCYLARAFPKPFDIDPGPGVDICLRSNWTTQPYEHYPITNDYFLMMLPSDGNYRKAGR